MCEWDVCQRAKRWHIVATFPGEKTPREIMLADDDDKPIRGDGAREKAIAAAAKLWRNVRREKSSDAEKITVRELCEAWAAHARVYYRWRGRETSAATNAIIGVRLFREIYGGERVAALRHADMLVLRDALARSGIARKTVNRRLWVVRSMLAWGLDEDLISAAAKTELSQVRGLKRGRSIARETTPVRAVDDAIIDATLPAMVPTLADMVQVQRLTGMRPCELCALRWECVDTSTTPWIYRPPEEANKNAWRGEIGKPRAICIGPRARAILAKYHGETGALFSPRKSLAEFYAAKIARAHCHRAKEHGHAKQESAAGEAWRTQAYTRAIHRACTRAGVEIWAANRLRHNFATRVRRVFGYEACRAVLGHTGGGGATDIYSYDAAADDMIRRAAPAVEALG